MFLSFLKSKLHGVTVTGACVDYEGSVEIDAALMEEANLLPYERVDIYNITNGNRFSTYTIVGKPGSGDICINGAAARLAKPGDKVIIASYCQITSEEVSSHVPKVVHFKENNVVRRD